MEANKTQRRKITFAVNDTRGDQREDNEVPSRSTDNGPHDIALKAFRHLPRTRGWAQPRLYVSSPQKESDNIWERVELGILQGL